MKGRRCSQEQIVYALKRVESGAKGSDACRELGVSAANFYLWKGKCGGMSVGELGRLRQLEEENQRLKWLVAGLSVDKKCHAEHPTEGCISVIGIAL